MTQQEACAYIRKAAATSLRAEAAMEKQAAAKILQGAGRMLLSPFIGRGSFTSGMKSIARRLGGAEFSAYKPAAGGAAKLVFSGRGKAGWGNRLYSFADRLQQKSRIGKKMYERGVRQQFKQVDAAGNPIMNTVRDAAGNVVSNKYRMSGLSTAMKYAPTAGLYGYMAAPATGLVSDDNLLWKPYNAVWERVTPLGLASKGVAWGANKIEDIGYDAAQEAAEATANGIADQYGNLGFMERLYGAINPAGFSDELRSQSLARIQQEIANRRYQ